MIRPVRTTFASQLGFTMVELIVVMMIIGILSIAALPRISDSTSFDSRRFNDEVMSALQYGHKIAVASRRNICVAFTSNSVSLTMAGTAGAAQPCNLNLTGPNGTTPFTVTAPGTTTFSSLPSNFFFNALGRSSVGTQTFQVTGTPFSITVEQESGYVHP